MINDIKQSIDQVKHERSRYVRAQQESLRNVVPQVVDAYNQQEKYLMEKLEKISTNMPMGPGIVLALIDTIKAFEVQLNIATGHTRAASGIIQKTATSCKKSYKDLTLHGLLCIVIIIQVILLVTVR